MTTKQPSTLDSLGNIKKPIRKEPRSKRKQRVALLPFSTRLTQETYDQIQDLADHKDWTMQEVIKQAVEKLHKRTKII
jgi:hypothetical protein